MPVTEKLFETDSYLQRFPARVLSCTPVPQGYGVVLDRTAFFSGRRRPAL